MRRSCYLDLPVVQLAHVSSLQPNWLSLLGQSISEKCFSILTGDKGKIKTFGNVEGSVAEKEAGVGRKYGGAALRKGIQETLQQGGRKVENARLSV